MKINYEAIPDLFPARTSPIAKVPGKYFCLSCKKTLDEKQYFKSSRMDKFPTGYLPHCKTCITLGIDDTDPLTFLSILKEINVPYIPSEWRSLVVKKDAKSASIIGKYVSKMRLAQYKKYTWNDTEKLAKDEQENLLAALRQESISESEAEEKLENYLSMNDITPQHQEISVAAAAVYGLVPETSKYNLTQDEINKLKVTWGDEYTEDQYLALEQMFADMMNSYVIQDPIAIQNAKVICKMNAKLNKYLDLDDVESASKISRQLDLFIKTANLAAVQSKDRQTTTFAISQLAFLVEKEGGFIPDFFMDAPNDNIDLILQDMREYTEYLVRGENNIDEMVKNTEEILAQDALPTAVADISDFAVLEAELLGEIEEIDEVQKSN